MWGLMFNDLLFFQTLLKTDDPMGYNGGLTLCKKENYFFFCCLLLLL